MVHMIISKFQDRGILTAEFMQELEQLFAKADQIPGVHGARIITNCIDRENRYDIIIEVAMEKDALSAWDASEVHAAWKKNYGALLAAKAIFDRE